ncbi:MAG: lysophospholipid acyltransferase family protein [Pirellulaceae bacterium]
MKSLPSISRPLLGGFQWFVARYLRKNFHAVAVNREHLLAVMRAEGESIGPDDALVIFANHASWWDPLTAIFVAQRLFGDYVMYAPIDAEALRKYPMFGRMGFFGVEQQSRLGTAEFLGIAEEILSHPGASLWVTPEGRFADVRDTSARLMPGLAHLARKIAARRAESLPADGGAQNGDFRSRCVWFIPVAVEYTFWEERQPELLMWFGRPLSDSAMQGEAKSQWDRELSERLRAAQRELASAVVARDVSQFDILLGGRSGSFFIYDWWRKLLGLLRGRRVQVEHGQKLNER